MSLEHGGKADKDGNKYEYEWVICQILQVIKRNIRSFIWEPIGPSSDGVDISVIKEDYYDYHQCKASNAGKDSWTISDLKKNNIISRWIDKLSINDSNEVSLVSPLTFKGLADLSDKARNSNNCGKDFYDYQIANAGKDTRKLFESICRELIGDLEKYTDDDYNRILSYLKRINIRQISDSTLHEMNISTIESLFLTNKDLVYKSLLTTLLNENNYSHSIDSQIIGDWLNRNNLQLRNLRNDSQVIGKIKSLNDRFKANYPFSKNEFVERNCYDECYKVVNKNVFTIIHGSAGIGKSGLLFSLMQKCEANQQPYVAINLKDCSPDNSLDTWSHDKLDLPINLVDVIHQVYEYQSPIIILDQLDTMRWTSRNYHESYCICREIINTIMRINENRTSAPIRLVLVTRSYDLEYSEYIKNITDNELFSRFEVQNLSDDEIHLVIGDEYNQLNKRTKQLLKRFLNLRIWLDIKLKSNNSSRNFQTQSQLLDTWISQIKKSIVEKLDIKDTDINICIRKFCEYCVTNQVFSVPCIVLEDYSTILNQLESEGLIINDRYSYSYIHQAVFDYFIAKDMLKQLLMGNSLEEIIGSKSEQTPWRRYQVQMMLDQLYNRQKAIKFLEVGETLLRSENIRFYVKHVFFEIIGQIDEINEKIISYISKNFFDEEWGIYLQEAIRGNLILIERLIELKVFERFLFNKESIRKAIWLLGTVECNTSTICTELIVKFFKLFPESKSEFSNIFYKECIYDCDEFFLLRIEYYKEFFDSYSVMENLKSLIKYNDFRFFELLKVSIVHDDTGESYKDYSSLDIHISLNQLRKLIELIPLDINSIESRNWIANKQIFSYKRLLVEIIKSAIQNLCDIDESNIWLYITEFWNVDNYIYKEIILFTFSIISTQYSEEILQYLVSDIKQNMFDYSSNNDNALIVVKNVIHKHTSAVKGEVLSYFIDKVLKYISKSHFKYIHNERNGKLRFSYLNAYSSYWGAFQYNILNSIDTNRLNEKVKGIISVLNRKYPNGIEVGVKTKIVSGYVRASIPFKKLSMIDWKKLLTNKQIDINRTKRRYNQFSLIENNTSTISYALSHKIEEKTNEMVNLIISIGNDINIEYIECVLSKLTDEKVLSKLSGEELSLFISHICTNFLNAGEDLTKYLIQLIDKRINLYKYSYIRDFIEALFCNYRLDSMRNPNIKKAQDLNSFKMEELNSSRGWFIHLICHLLDTDYITFESYKNKIISIMDFNSNFDKYLYLKFLISGYNKNKDIGKEIVNSLLLNCWLCNSEYNNFLLMSLYNDGYKTSIISVIEKSYHSSDYELRQLADYCILELYMKDADAVKSYMQNTDSLRTHNHLYNMMQMANIYWQYEEYIDRIKSWYIMMQEQKLDIFKGISQLFSTKLIVLGRDTEFVNIIFSSGVSRALLHQFIDFIKDNKYKVSEIYDLFIKTVQFIIQHHDECEFVGVSASLDELLAYVYELSCKERHLNGQQQCLDFWDDMYKYQMGNIREITDQMI